MGRKTKKPAKNIVATEIDLRGAALRTFLQRAQLSVPLEPLHAFFVTGDESKLPDSKIEGVREALAKLGGGERPNIGFALVQPTIIEAEPGKLNDLFDIEASVLKKGEQRRADYHLYGGKEWEPRFDQIATQAQQSPASTYEHH